MEKRTLRSVGFKERNRCENHGGCRIRSTNLRLIMSKRTILVLVSILGSISIWAQSPPPGVISRSPAATNIIATGTGTFTNQSGAIYSADQLAAQLQNLRTAIEQTLP